MFRIDERSEFPANPPFESTEPFQFDGRTHVNALHFLRNINGRNIRKRNLRAKGPELAAQFPYPIGQRLILNLYHQINRTVILNALFQFDPNVDLLALSGRLMVHSVGDLLQSHCASSPETVHHL